MLTVFRTLVVVVVVELWTHNRFKAHKTWSAITVWQLIWKKL